MSILPKEIKLTLHAQQRLEERKGPEKYNTKNLMRSSCRWYGKDDLIKESSLYIHCMYVCRKAKNKMGYLTDGNIEVLYDKNAKVAITILEVKDKFKPITQYIKPEYLKEIELKKTWESYITNMVNSPMNNQNEKIVTVPQKRYQITTESISTIYNTKRPFTRVFYAASKEEAYGKFVKWMAERQLHEDKSKTTVVELQMEGEDGRKKE